MSLLQLPGEPAIASGAGSPRHRGRLGPFALNLELFPAAEPLVVPPRAANPEQARTDHVAATSHPLQGSDLLQALALDPNHREARQLLAELDRR